MVKIIKYCKWKSFTGFVTTRSTTVPDGGFDTSPAPRRCPSAMKRVCVRRYVRNVSKYLYSELSLWVTYNYWYTSIRYTLYEYISAFCKSNTLDLFKTACANFDNDKHVADARFGRSSSRLRWRRSFFGEHFLQSLQFRIANMWHLAIACAVPIEHHQFWQLILVVFAKLALNTSIWRIGEIAILARVVPLSNLFYLIKTYL